MYQQNFGLVMHTKVAFVHLLKQHLCSFTTNYRFFKTQFCGKDASYHVDMIYIRIDSLLQFSVHQFFALILSFACIPSHVFNYYFIINSKKCTISRLTVDSLFENLLDKKIGVKKNISCCLLLHNKRMVPLFVCIFGQTIIRAIFESLPGYCYE